MLTLFILSYTLGAVVTYGAGFAYWQGLSPKSAVKDYKRDMRGSASVAWMWPVGIVIYLLTDGRKPFQSGLKFY